MLNSLEIWHIVQEPSPVLSRTYSLYEQGKNIDKPLFSCRLYKQPSYISNKLSVPSQRALLYTSIKRSDEVAMIASLALLLAMSATAW